MEFSQASIGVDLLDLLYSALVAFVLTGVAFATLRILPRPVFVRRKSPQLLAAKATSAVFLMLGATVFSALYTGVITLSYGHGTRFIP